jgi:3',5'-cyclic AMP phosphodiesterase CpdA
MSEKITIAHLSDVHLSPVAGFMPWHWNAKRALGYANWTTKRRHVHMRSIADRLVADIKRQAPDHIAVTGDLINIGLPSEYAAAAAWLRSVGEPAAVSLVPGNHDIYTRLRRDAGVERWRAYMASDAWGAQHSEPAHRGFPYLRRTGPVAIIGLCSAVETAPGVATGKLGPSQLAAASALLDRLAGQQVFRLVLIHHPPLPGQTRPSHELIDAPEFRDVLARSGAELVLHGHTHLPTVTSVDCNGRPVPVVGVASASAGRTKGLEPLAHYGLLQISGSHGAWQVALRRRGLSTETGEIGELQTLTIT